VHGAQSSGHSQAPQLAAQWSCRCEAGFTGADCSRLKELSCGDELDNDLDGLVDCEDEDCCEQPVCRDNLLCFKSPEPVRALRAARLAALRAPSGSSELATDHAQLGASDAAGFFNKWRFLIANGSVQSYAQPQAFDRRRAAVLRGQVVKGALDGVFAGGHAPADSLWAGAKGSTQNERPPIVSVRVSVLEYAAFGFTLSRGDGYFDLLVNGDEWLTLIFHRQAYTPLKRRLFVQPNRINVLAEQVEMWQPEMGQKGALERAEQAAEQKSPILSSRNSMPFHGLGLSLALAANEAQHRPQQQQQSPRSAAFVGCLVGRLMRLSSGLGAGDSDDSPNSAREQQLEEEPLILLDDDGRKLDKLRAFSLASGPKTAYQTSIETRTQLGPIQYNSAHFQASNSAAKPTVSIQLIGATRTLDSLKRLLSIRLHLDIEGQSRNVLFGQAELLPGLSYQFAWNRRNVYGQKVFGFGEMNIRVEYEYSNELQENNGPRGQRLQWNLLESAKICNQQQNYLEWQHLERNLHQIGPQLERHLSRRGVTFRRRIFLEANQPKQYAEIGKWSLNNLARHFDAQQKVLYFSSTWMLPFHLVYPPVVGPPLSLSSMKTIERLPNLNLAKPKLFAQPAESSPSGNNNNNNNNGHNHNEPLNSGKLVCNGPLNSIFFIRLQHHNNENGPNNARLVQYSWAKHQQGGEKLLLDVPLSTLTSKFGAPFQHQQQQQGALLSSHLLANDLHLLFNNFESSLYISSKSAGKMVRISMASLVLLNKTLNGNSVTLDPDDEIDIEPVCGFHNGRSPVIESGNFLPSSGDQQQPVVKQCKFAKFDSIHSLALDEHNQLMYFVAGAANIMVVDLNSNIVVSLTHLQQELYNNNNNNNNNKHNKQQDKRHASPWRMGTPLEHQAGASRGCLWEARVELERTLQESDYKAQHVRSLVWSQADSSLYFVDGNAIVALRQDLTLQLVALGHKFGHLAGALLEQQGGKSFRHYQQQEKECNHERGPLGSIKSITMDESNGFELLVVHQWQLDQQQQQQQHQQQRQEARLTLNNKDNKYDATEERKTPGHYYLAKIGLGPRCLSGGEALLDRNGSSSIGLGQINIFDLHSSQSTWNGLIQAVSSPTVPPSVHPKSRPINWAQLARRPKFGSHSNDWIPFIHLSSPFSTTGGQTSNGFARADSIEINPIDGSIFVLDWRDQSVRQVKSYSPQEFNSIGGDVQRVWEASEQQQQASSRLSPSGPRRQTPDSSDQRPLWSPNTQLRLVTGATNNTSIPNNLLLLRNPIDLDEEMEFHWPSGLLLSTSRSQPYDKTTAVFEPLAPSSSGATKLQLVYKTFTRNEDSQSLGHIVEQEDQDEDQPTLLQIASLSKSPHKGPQELLALDSVIRSTYREGHKTSEEEYQLLRDDRSLRLNVESIVSNQRKLCQFNHDTSGTLVRVVELPLRNNWTELVYDPKDYLLRNVIISTNTMESQPTTSHQQQVQSKGYFNVPYQNYLYQNYNQQRLADDNNQNLHQGLKRSTNRIVYDKVFNHYCDLFLVDM